jgi:flagellar protein FlgJ
MNLSPAGYANGVTGPSEALVPSDGRRAAAGTPASKLWEQCTAFESLFLNAMMKELRNSVPESEGAMAPSPARKMMQSMMDERMVDRLAERGSAGIAESLYQDFRKHGSLLESSRADALRKATAGAELQPNLNSLA